MPNLITIRNVRAIEHLEFTIPGPGVHLLTGTNGSGKTSVLACLRRIGFSDAFARHFSGPPQPQLDTLDHAEIQYTVNGASVTYAYGGQRWVPRPRSQAGLLRQLGYSHVLYMGATADRITPTAADFQISRAAGVAQALKDAINRILGTQRFAELRQMRVAPRGGRGPVAFLVPVGHAGGRTLYATEGSFSLGELCVIKLLWQLSRIANNALVLIDELELALHPTAQARLLEYLESVAREKQLTVVFSTHSVNLLKRVRRQQLLLLERRGSEVVCIPGCYPTYALGAIALDEEDRPDAVIFVEDLAAQQVTEALVRLVLARRFPNDPHLRPSYLIVPVGGFLNVVRFLPRGQALLPRRVNSHALLDADVLTETIPQLRRDGNHEVLAEIQAVERQAHYLPWTPEVGLTEYLIANAPLAQAALREALGNNQLRIDPATFGALPAAGAARRDAAKRIVADLAAGIAANLVDREPEEVTRVLYQGFAKSYFDAQVQQIMGLIAPLVVR